MATDKVICPQCGAVNIESPLITMCSTCLGSLEGAQPAPEPAPSPAREMAPRRELQPAAEAPPEAPSVLDAEPEPVTEPEAPEPPPPAEPVVPEPPAAPEPIKFEPARTPDIPAPPPPPSPLEAAAPPAPEPPAEAPPAPPERESFQPARSPDVGPTVSGPLYAELPSPTGPADFQPRRSEVPPLEIPTIPSGASVAEPTGEPAGPAFRALKVICPNCRAANPPNFLRCNLCNTPLPTAAADTAGGSDWMHQWHTQPDRIRGSTSGQTKWGAACGCLVMGFIFFVLIVLSALR
jgi:hypothetical protein